MEDDEILLYPFKTDYDYDALSIAGCGTWDVELLDRSLFLWERRRPMLWDRSLS